VVEGQEEQTTDENALKRVAFYQEMVSGWVNTVIESDKQAIGLSGLAIGLLMTFRSSIDTGARFVLWSLASVSFFAAVIVGMRVLYLNALYVEQVLSGENEARETQVLNHLSRMTTLIYSLFIIGAFLTALLAASTSPFLTNCGVCR